MTWFAFQRLSDAMILTGVGFLAAINARDEWVRLIKRQRAHGLFRVRIAAPRLADEKFLWRKLFDHDPRFVTLTDKLAAKEWVERHGFDARMPRTLWFGQDAHDVPDCVWNTPMFLKATHGYQMNIPVLSPPADRAAIIARANAFLDRDHGRRERQWAYGKVPRRLIAEEAVLSGAPSIEMKLYTYGETIEQFLVIRRGPPLTATRWIRNAQGTFNRSGQRTSVTQRMDDLPLPEVASKALDLASRIGGHFDSMRVDVMTDEEDLYLGELTVYPVAGRAYLQGHYAAAAQNRSWDLRRSWFLTVPQTGWRWHYAAALRRRIDRREMKGHGLA